MLDLKNLWTNTLLEVELHVSKANFSTWFKNTDIVKEEGGIVFVGVPNEFVKDWIFNKYHKFILQKMRDTSEFVRGVEYVVVKNIGEKPKIVIADFSKSPLLRELPLADLYINKEDNLNPRYTFDSFVIGSFNELAYSAAQAVLEKPGMAYNPLFIYGRTGLGKTHLIQSVGNTLKTKFNNRKVFYTTSEKFSVDFVTSMQANKIPAFKEKYRKYDVLIVDDVQFLSNKDKTQEELFHLFNAFYDNNKQIIFSSDVHPNFIPNLEERLKSRFGAGMTVDVGQPEYESRLSILSAKAKENNFYPPEEVMQYIASLIQGNIRELEGALNLIICHTKLKNKDLSLYEIKNLLKNNIKPKKNMAVKDVVKIIADFYNIEEASVYEKTRRKDVVKPRQVAMYILREEFDISYPSIGQKMGGRDHTTVIHSCEKIKKEIKTDNSLLQELEQIKALF